VVAARLGRVLGVYKPGQTNDEAVREGIPEKVAWAAYGAFFVFATFGTWGAIVLRRRRVPVFPLLGAILVVVVATASFYGLFRYRFAADLALVVLAGIGVDALWDRVVHGRTVSPAAGAPQIASAHAEDDQDVQGGPPAPPAGPPLEALEPEEHALGEEAGRGDAS
jgi:hypothetical protein